ncbi:hypothetical protein CIG1485E_1224 [Campylobacter iguaniorum]|uniref:Uncharacterized protein n=1 Tax=Campylobacter iguaniorum TaxID=1244531 RepID=A0A076FBI3_9BACT|nr:hypothetical protein CIG1485E_1224 [Campylobacter iguaniorum]
MGFGKKSSLNVVVKYYCEVNLSLKQSKFDIYSARLSRFSKENLAMTKLFKFTQ